MENMIWLSISLFCLDSQWGTLFSKGIVPFLADPETNVFLTAYTIEFNYLSGANIRLSLCTSEVNSSKLAIYTDRYFKKFFLNANFFSSKTKLPVAGIFKPFPLNTIQYGLYLPHRTIDEKNEDYVFANNFSSIILNALKNDTIDEECIVTLAFYLQMGLLKVVQSGFPGFIPEYAHNGAINMDIIKTKFEESKATLLEITKDVLETNNGSDIALWLEEWLCNCKTELKKYNEGKIAYQRIVVIINKHLAIRPALRTMLGYFIEQSLLDSNPI